MHPSSMPQVETVQDNVAGVAPEGNDAPATPQQPTPPLATVEQLLVEAAIQCPEADALVGSFGTLSYADLLIRAQNIAVVLRQQGIGPGHFVGVAMDQSPVMITSIAGILLAGAAYVPLGRDLLQDPQALRIIRASGVAFILCDRSYGTGSCTLWTEFGTVLDASRMEQQTMPASDETHLPPTTPDAAAAVLFRRSSVRDPLAETAVGVVIPHRAIARLVASDRLIGFHANETFLLHPHMSMRTGLLELWGSLLHRATLALAPDAPASGALSAGQLAQTIRQFGVSTLGLPVAVLHELIDREPKTFARLNQLVIEQNGNHGTLSPQRLQWLASNHPRLRIVHTYGTVETSGYATSYPVPAQYLAQASVPVGQPIDGMQAIILDRELFPTREGEIGELAFAGDGVVSGYLMDPDTTAQRFLRRETSNDLAGSHVFLSGERARWRSDGLLELHGRSARHAMSAVLPQWLEPAMTREFGTADIEAMLISQQKVRDAAILEHVDEQGIPQQVAFVALEAPHPETRASLEQSMRSALPPAAMPATFHYVETIPRDDRGSVDPLLLRQQVQQKSDRVESDDRRNQEILEQVRGIWLRLLQRVSVGYDEDFFAAGGTQVQMIRMHVELNRKFPGAITMANLSVLRTIHKIHDHLMEHIAQNKMAATLSGRGA